jgi:hypothetical protein
MTMKTREIFLKDPLSWRLLNNGVSSNNADDEALIKYELQTFVCEGEYFNGLTRILGSFLACHGAQQNAAWVSGFYGSGKSHLVKVIRYLWSDHEFSDGQRARAIANLPDDVHDLLKELSTRGASGGGLHSAGGTLKSEVGTTNLRVLAMVFGSMGLPKKVSQGRLALDLVEDGSMPTIQAALRAAEADEAKAILQPYTDKHFLSAYVATHPHFKNESEASKALLASYPPSVAEISVEEMARDIRRALSRDGKIPETIIVLDEAQQYINNNPDVSLELQEVIEACSTMLDGSVMVVATGQSALSDTPSLQRLMGRFKVKAHLKDTDVERVVRRVVLHKKEDKRTAIEAIVAKQQGEITRQLKNSKIATKADDEDSYVADFPVLPVRRRFWEQVLHAVDSSGTAAQMRTQLSLAYEACKALAEKPLGAIVPADFIYDQLAADLVMSGEMQRRFQEIVEEQRTKPDGALRSRVCALVFLINKLPREAVDIGVRATVEDLADLLTDDLGDSATRLREKLPQIVAQLVHDGVLMEVEGEYRLLTPEGATWEQEYRRQRSAILGQEPQIAGERGRLLSGKISTLLGSAGTVHGAAKVKRSASVHQSSSAPGAHDGLVVWVRDGFQESEAAVIKDIQQRSVEDATIHVLIPKVESDRIKNAIASHLAATGTLHSKGSPSTEEGKDARKSIEAKQRAAELQVEDAADTILSRARVFLSGGQEVTSAGLFDDVRSAASQVLGRLYPKFALADHSNWPTVWKKAKEGSADALSAVGYSGDPDKHPLAAELLRCIGAGKKGGDIRSAYEGAPYGWPSDAIDAILGVLMVTGHVSARIGSTAVTLADLDQRRIKQAEFRVQHPVLSAPQKLRIRKLFQDLGHKFTPGDEGGAAPGFLTALKELQKSAGGPAPAPEAPASPKLIELEGKTGNDLLFDLYSSADDLTTTINDLKALSKKVAERTPLFHRAERLVKHAQGLAGGDTLAATIDSIRSNRSLLNDPNPCEPVLQDVGALLRSAIQAAHNAYETTYTDRLTHLDSVKEWGNLPADTRKSLLQAAGVAPKPAPQVSKDTDLLGSLDASSLEDWKTQSQALPTRCEQAMAEAIRIAAPKARRVSLPSRTINSPAELDAWLEEVKKRIAAALGDGPVIV